MDREQGGAPRSWPYGLLEASPLVEVRQLQHPQDYSACHTQHCLPTGWIQLLSDGHLATCRCTVQDLLFAVWSASGIMPSFEAYICHMQLAV